MRNNQRWRRVAQRRHLVKNAFVTGIFQYLKIDALFYCRYDGFNLNFHKMLAKSSDARENRKLRVACFSEVRVYVDVVKYSLYSLSCSLRRIGWG